MSTQAHPDPAPTVSGRMRLRPGDLGLRGLATLAAIALIVMMVLLVWKVYQLAEPAVSQYGLGFITATDWNPVPQTR